MIKIAYFGSSAFSAKVLAALLDRLNPEAYAVRVVVSQAGKPVGRSRAIAETPVTELAERRGIAVLKPENLRDEEFKKALAEPEPNLIIVAAYGKIIPADVLAMASRGALNVHGSLLPAYRGASPIHQALLDGASETGITIMLMDAGMDHGPILLERAIPISPDETFPELEARLATLAEDLLLEAIPSYLDGTLLPQEQDHAAATFTKIIDKQDGEVNWEDPAQSIYNKYRAYATWPGIWTKLDGKILKIKTCAMGPAVTGPKLPVGTVSLVDGGEEKKCVVRCGQGCLELLEVQLEGGKPIPIQDFLKGHTKFVGSTLGM